MTAGHGDDPPGPPASPSPLRSTAYRRLLAGQVVTTLGSAIAPVALAFAVLDLGGDATELGLVIASYALAEVLTVLGGGVLGDRFDRRTVMVAAAALSAVSQGVAAASLVSGWASLTLLAVLGMANGCLAALGLPSSQAMTPLTVSAEQLSAAVALRRLGQSLAQIVGAGSAGLLVVAVGSGWALAVDALTFAVAAGFFAALPVRRPVAGSSAGPSLRRDLAAGLREVTSRSWLWVLVVQALLYHLFYGGAQGVLGPIVVGNTLGRPAWGWALAAMMTGFVVGGGLSLVYRPRHLLRTGVLFLILTAAFPAAIAFSDSLLVILLGAFLHGLGLEMFSVGWDVALQQQVPADRLSRVYAFDVIGSFAARPLGLAFTGPLAEATGLRSWLAVVAAVMVTSTLAALLVPDVRRLTRR